MKTIYNLMYYNEYRNMGVINNGEYDGFDAECNILINRGDHIYLSMFIDASGTTFLTDSSGNDINHKLLVKTVYTYPYTDPDSGLPVEGNFTIFFDDGTSFDNIDTYKGYYYILHGVDDPPIIKLFT